MTSENQTPADPRVLDLYNDYAHGRLNRRNFVRKVSGLAVGGFSAATLIRAVMPNYAKAQTIMFTDPRIKAQYVEYPSPRGSSGKMRGYLVVPAQASRPLPAVVVIHENRGLNPYVEDVARRAAAQGFLALAPDGLAPVGGYPGNDDYGRMLQAQLDPEKLDQDMIASAYFLKSHPDASGKIGATGFCWGGGMVNRMAAAMGADFNAGVPYYGRSVSAADAGKIKAGLLIQYAGEDPGINGMWPDYQKALQASKVEHAMNMYPGTMHGFHNNSTPRFNPEAAKLSEDRMWAYFKQKLA